MIFFGAVWTFLNKDRLTNELKEDFCRCAREVGLVSNKFTRLSPVGQWLRYGTVKKQCFGVDILRLARDNLHDLNVDEAWQSTIICRVEGVWFVEIGCDGAGSQR